jgi:deoxyguanosine kinase
MIDKHTIPHRFIAIEGNIGAGKTTFCHLLQRDLGCRLVLEQFTDNPFLPSFYENPERYAFPVELFFMTERHKQLQTELSQPDLFEQLIVADYFFIKTLLFAKNNLNNEEHRLFKRLFKVLNSTFPNPEMLIYLHRPVENLLQNIQQRGRDYEKDITGEYLQEIQNAYFDYFKTTPKMPIVVVQLNDLDYMQDNGIYQKLLEILSKTYENGVHYESLTNQSVEF